MNPWNTTMSLDVNDDIKNEVSTWIKEVRLNRGEKRKIFLNENNLSLLTQEYLKNLYDKGYGFKVLARTFETTYSMMRFVLIEYLNHTCRKGLNISTEITKTFRSERVLGEKSPFYNWVEKNPKMIKHSTTGIQGYYKNNDEFIWLRSSWEYTFVKWLNHNNISWKPCHKSYKLSDTESYLPDFEIFINDKWTIVELKGDRYKQRLYKVDMFNKKYNQDVMVITDIKPYILENRCYKQELEEWKNVRLLKKDL